MSEFSIHTAADLKPGLLIQALVFSKYKVGKTFGAGSFPRPCVIDFDRGAITFRHPEFVARHGVAKLREIIVEPFYEVSKDNRGIVITHNAFDKACRFFDWMMSPANRNKFDTWVVDTGTTLQAASMNKAIVLLGGSDGFSGNKSQTHKMAREHGLLLPKIQDFGAERSMVTQFVQMLKDSGKHFLFLCHEKEQSNKDGETTGIVPLLTGRGVEEIGCMFDEVWNLRMLKRGGGYARILQTHQDELRHCGSRYGVPSFDSLTQSGGIEFDYAQIKRELDKIIAAQAAQNDKLKEEPNNVATNQS